MEILKLILDYWWVLVLISLFCSIGSFILSAILGLGMMTIGFICVIIERIFAGIKFVIGKIFGAKDE